MKRYLAALLLVLGLGISASASADNFWLHPYGDATSILECHNCLGRGFNYVVLHDVPSWSMPTKGVEYGTNFIVGSGTTKTVQKVYVSSPFAGDESHPCREAGACTVYLCLTNVACADITSDFQAGSDATTLQFAGRKWWGGDELWFALYYQVHGSGAMLPVRTSLEELLYIEYTDG